MNSLDNSIFTMRKRLLFLSFAVFFFIAILIIRLFVVQVISNQHLTSRATDQWYRELPLQAPRGRMISTNGVELAGNANLFTIYIRPRTVRDIDRTANILSEHTGMLQQQIVSKISTANVSEITLIRHVNADVAESIRQHNLGGVYFTMDARRSYPFGNFLTQVLGFTNIDNAGQNGLELYYDRFLRGVNGFSYTGTDLRGFELRNNVTRYVPAIPGFDLHLGIDSNIQHFVEDAVRDAHIEWQSNGVSMMVYDLVTGAIVASAASPSFDLNEPPRDKLDLLNAMSKNIMITDVYEPGSTFKVFTIAAALDAGVLSLDEKFFCPGYRVVDGQRIRCWRTRGHGIQTVQKAINNSCNSFIMDIAQRLGVERLYSYLRAFGFGELTGVDFFGESRGIMLAQSNVKLVDLVRIGFGQTIAVTTLQMVRAVGAVVTGVLMQPYFAQSIVTPHGRTMYSRAPRINGHPIRQETAATMRQILATVVAEGSGRRAQVSGFEVGGKTGTAQKYYDGAVAPGRYVSSFVGFAPVYNPRFVALLAVDEPKGYLYYGSMTAAPYVGRVFEYIARHWGIPRVPQELPTMDMPNMLGLSFVQAEQVLDSMQIQFEMSGDGDRVIGTVPAFGSRISSNDVVLVRLG